MSFDSERAGHTFGMTESAARKILKLVETHEVPAVGLRVGVRGGGCAGFSYFMEVAPEGSVKDTDLVFERDGAKLVIDPRSLALLDGGELDWVSSLMGASFKVTNPNAKRACGCGSSFSV